MERPGVRGSARVRVLALAVLAIAFGAPCTAQAATPGDTLGVYRGSGAPDRVAAFESTLGRKVSRAHDFLDKSTWSSLLDVSWMAGQWTSGGYANGLVISVAMLPNTEPSGYGPLSRGASGAFNAYFRTLAERLVQHGLGSSVLRLGHEFNGTWFKWSMNVTNGAADYVAYWRQIVNTMRSVAGANFKFDWSPNADSSWVNGKQLQAADAWPGEAYVDYVGLDVYNQSWIPNYTDPVARWKQYVNQPNGLAWQAAFAASKGKRLTFPEWGLVERADGHGGGDDPYFIEQMHSWMQSHDVAYNLYFDFKDQEAEYGVFSGRFPNAASAFIRLFGPAAPAPPPGVAHDTGQPGAPGGAAGSSSAAFAEFARLCIDQAQISPSTRRLKLRASITRRASGEARVELQAGGRKTRFSKTIAGGRVQVSRKLSQSQARKGTGIVKITYGGNAHTKPQQVRMRLAPGKANLSVRMAPALSATRLKSSGTISRRANGVVRVQLKYDVDGQTVTRQYKAQIRKGRWRLDARLSQGVRSEIGARTSAVHAYALYTGSLSRRIGGQMKSYQVLAPT